MNRSQKTDDRRQKTEINWIRRPALILSSQTQADCPIDGTCVSTVGEGRAARQLTCGHYKGSITNNNGSQVVCGYVGS